MKVVVWEPARESEWDAYIQQHPLSIAWQQYGWSRVVLENYKVRFYPLAALRGTSLCGVLPLYHYKSLKGQALISVPFAVAGGILADDPEAEQALLERAVALSKTHDNCQIRLKQYKHKIEGELQVDDKYYNRELSLTQNIQALRERVAPENLKQVEAGAALGFTVNRNPDLPAFYKLLRIHHHRKGIPCVARKWLESLVRSGWYTMATVEWRGKPIAGTMIKHFKDTVSFPFTCALDDGEKAVLSLYHLYWEIIKAEAERGGGIFHSGRIPVTDDTEAYRLGWGGERHTYYNQYYPKSVTQTEFSQKRGGKRVLFQKLWRKTPEFVVDQLGPVIVRQYP